MQARRLHTVWLGLALGAGTCVGAAVAQYRAETLYLSDYQLLEPTAPCLGGDAKLLESTLVATGVPVSFDSYVKTDGEYCATKINRGIETADVAVDCGTGRKLSPEEVPIPASVIKKSVEIRATVQLCIRPTEIQAELVGPVEMSPLPGGEVFNIAKDEVGFVLGVPGRTFDTVGYGALFTQPDGAYVTLYLDCLPGGLDETTGRDLFATSHMVEFKITESLPEDCMKGRCKIPYQGLWDPGLPQPATCSTPGASP